MINTELKALAATLATERGIDLRYDWLPPGAIPRYDRTLGTPSAGLGDTSVIEERVDIALLQDPPDAAVIEQFLTDEPGHVHYRLPCRSLGGVVTEWGLAGFS